MAMKEINKTRKAGVENVILTRYFRIGDSVVMNMDPESRGWGRKGPDNGTKGTVMGFYRYKRDVSIIDTYAAPKPGIYEGNGAAVIQWENGDVTNESGSDVYFEDQSLVDVRHNDLHYDEVFESLVFVKKLPELPYEIGDKIVISRNNRLIQGTIDRFNYLSMSRKCNDGSPYPFIQYTNDDEGWHSSCNLEEVVDLVKHGNFWWWQHDKEKIKFADLKEEAAFYKSLGFAEQCKNPRSGNYGWTLDELLLAIQAGEIDIIQMTQGFFGASDRPIAYRFPTMPELGKRLREETMKGFADELAFLNEKGSNSKK